MVKMLSVSIKGCLTMGKIDTQLLCQFSSKYLALSRPFKSVSDCFAPARGRKNLLKGRE